MARFFEIYSRMQEEMEVLPKVQSPNTLDGDGDGPLLDSGEDTKAMEVIRAGKALDKNFWENFIKICNNDGFAELLKIKSHQTSDWASRIKGVLEKVENMDSQKNKNKMLATGDSEPLAKDNDQGPISYPSDTRPIP